MAVNQDPVFVIGVFRSGTSLLCSILNQNPQVALMYECDVWNFPRPLLPIRFRRNWAKRIEFYNQALSRHQLIQPKETRKLDGIRTPLDLYRAFGARKGAAVCGEKSPFYCDRLEQLHQQYPSAFFIFVWRQPAEIYRSVLKAGQTSRFFGKPGMLSRMIYHQEQAVHQLALIEKKGARILRLSYAEIVEQTEKTSRAACAFLAVPYDAQMLQLNQADLSAIYREPHHAYLPKQRSAAPVSHNVQDDGNGGVGNIRAVPVHHTNRPQVALQVKEDRSLEHHPVVKELLNTVRPNCKSRASEDGTGVRNGLQDALSDGPIQSEKVD